MGMVVLRSTTPWVAVNSRSNSALLTVISMVPTATAASTGIMISRASGAKAQNLFRPLAARLKPRPDTNLPQCKNLLQCNIGLLLLLLPLYQI
jgi:hypothetical protein